MPDFDSEGPTLVTTVFVNATEKQAALKSIPPAGEATYLFYLNQPQHVTPIDSQLRSLQEVLRDYQRKSAIDRIYMKKSLENQNTLCYVERTPPEQFKAEKNALFSCDHLVLNLHDSNGSQRYIANRHGGEVQWDAFLSSPVLIFDDQYKGPGFWNFFEQLALRHAQWFNNGGKMKIQGLGVPILEEDDDSNYTLDIFADGCGINDRPEAQGKEIRSATKTTVKDCDALKDLLKRGKDYIHSTEKVIGPYQEVFHIRFTEDNGKKKDICVVHLRSGKDRSFGRRRSADVLRDAVEEISFLMYGEFVSTEDILSQETSIGRALHSTRLTFIVSKIILNAFQQCREKGIPLFHWLENLSRGELLKYKAGDSELFCIKINHKMKRLGYAVKLAVHLQKINLSYLIERESRRTINSSVKHQQVAMVDNFPAALNGSDHKSGSYSVSTPKNSHTKRKSVSRSGGDMGSETPRVVEHQLIHAQILGSDGVSNGSSKGEVVGSIARKKYLLKRNTQRGISIPEFIEVPEESHGLIDSMEPDFDGTTLSGSVPWYDTDVKNEKS